MPYVFATDDIRSALIGALDQILDHYGKASPDRLNMTFPQHWHERLMCVRDITARYVSVQSRQSEPNDVYRKSVEQIPLWLSELDDARQKTVKQVLPILAKWTEKIADADLQTPGDGLPAQMVEFVIGVLLVNSGIGRDVARALLGDQDALRRIRSRCSLPFSQ
jgi:hypothetical protein